MSTLTYSDGSYLLASGTRDAFGLASDQLVREGHPAINVVSGDREYETQRAIWNDRMVQKHQVNGRHVYSTMWWNGIQWYRIHPWVVAPPSRDAPHVARKAGDLGWPYNNRYTAAHARLVQIAPDYDLAWTGVNFSEDWHFEFFGALGIIGAAPAKPKPINLNPEPGNESEEDDDMTNSAVYYTRKSDGAIVYAIINTVSGFVSEYTDSRKGVEMGGPYNNPVAATFKTASFAKVTESHANALKASALAVLQAGSTVTVKLAEPVVVEVSELE